MAQVMINLGPMMLAEGDVQGADTMLDSSWTLSKHSNDLPSQVRATCQSCVIPHTDV